MRIILVFGIVPWLLAATEAKAITEVPINGDGAYVLRLKEHEVRGFYALLRMHETARSKKKAGGGSFVQGTFEIDLITKKTAAQQPIDPWRNDWTAQGSLEGIFQLRRLRSIELGSGDSDVTITHAVGTSRFKTEQSVYITFIAVTKDLLITISHTTSNGPRQVIGTYNVDMLSQVKVTTTNKSYNFDISLSGLTANLKKQKTSETSRLSLTIDGSPYLLDSGKLWLDRINCAGNPEVCSFTEIRFGQDFNTDALFDYKEAVPVVNASCMSGWQVNADVTWKKLNKAKKIIEEATTITSSCQVGSESLNSKIYWIAQPGHIFSGEDTTDAAGLAFRHRFEIDQINKRGKAFFDYLLLTNWRAQVATGPGGLLSFDLGSKITAEGTHRLVTTAFNYVPLATLWNQTAEHAE